MLLLISKTLLLSFIFPLLLLGAEIPNDTMQGHIIPYDAYAPQDKLSWRLICQHFLKLDEMPPSLYEKIFEKELARQCVFLASVFDKDYNSVQWILDHDTTYQQKTSNNGTIVRPEKNRFFYYSIYYDRSNHFTPFMIANHYEDEKMLTILRPLLSTLLNIEDKRESLLFSNQIPYTLYKITCTKDDPSPYKENFIQLDLDTINNYSQEFGNTFSHSCFFFIVAVMNNDERLFNFIKECCSIEDYSNKINPILIEQSFSNTISMIIKFAITVNDKKASFYTQEEIKKLVSHPFLIDKKDFILHCVNYNIDQYKNNPQYNRYNPQAEKAQEVLLKMGAQSKDPYKNEDNKDKLKEHNREWNVHVIFLLGLGAFLLITYFFKNKIDFSPPPAINYTIPAVYYTINDFINYD